MRFLQKLIDFYIQSSLHVAFSALSFVWVTQRFFSVSNGYVASFVFFGTVVGYNFVKYDALVRKRQGAISLRLKAIAVLSAIALVCSGYCFFQMKAAGQYIALGVFLLTLLYTLSFFPSRKNARHWKGVKIYIVALSWVGVTALLPLLNEGVLLTLPVILLCVQRFLLVFVLVLIFEIIDLNFDAPHLQTVPQMIGVNRTKRLGFIVLLLFLLVEVFCQTETFHWEQWCYKLLLCVFTAPMLFFAAPHRGRIYSAFWVESIPIVAFMLLILLEFFF
jgi:hypothetical protein